MTNAELIKALRRLSTAQDTDNSLDWVYGSQQAMHDAADALEAADKRIEELEDELRFQLDTRRKETAEIEQLKAENLKLQKQNRDCGWNCKQCEYVDKDIQAEEAEQRLMELDRRLYELRRFNAKMKGEQLPKEGEWIEDEYGYIHCSKCGMEWDEPEHPQTSYCPNRGARMRTVTDCHTLEEGER